MFFPYYKGTGPLFLSRKKCMPENNLNAIKNRVMFLNNKILFVSLVK
jgi:hypothetical protein